MQLAKIKEAVTSRRDPWTKLTLQLPGAQDLLVYPNSIHKLEESTCFIFQLGAERKLGIATGDGIAPPAGFQSEQVSHSDGWTLRAGPLSLENASELRRRFDFTRPKPMGLDRSYGMGDRLGLANPAHLRTLAPTELKPILAQQSIRELERTQRTAQEVLDTASWAVFQEGYHRGFGADGDHLKEVEDLDLVLGVGYTMVTFDPGDHVVNEADSMSGPDLQTGAASLPWPELEDGLADCIRRYANRPVHLSDNCKLDPNQGDVYRALVKYGRVLLHVTKLSRHLLSKREEGEIEIELSVDETDAVTTPFEHYFLVSELKRRQIMLTSVAPRFVGQLEKGVDYQGDLGLFLREYRKHRQIADYLGPYKLSLHSGSDKFSLYKILGSEEGGAVHVKTAGTSYLEALKAVAEINLPLFKEIMSYSIRNYEEAKQTYHVSATTDNLPQIQDLNVDDTITLIADSLDARQILHVNFGGVLTDRDQSGQYLFRDSILQILRENEDVHFRYLDAHFQRHIEPFM